MHAGQLEDGYSVLILCHFFLSLCVCCSFDRGKNPITFRAASVGKERFAYRAVDSQGLTSDVAYVTVEVSHKPKAIIDQWS